jgi:RHS repeat-associated protein
LFSASAVSSLAPAAVADVPESSARAGATVVGYGYNPKFEYRFAGYWYGTSTGIYKVGARYYYPSDGRWMQRDPPDKPLALTGWNRYIYAGDDPVNLTDRSGTTPFGRCDEPQTVPWRKLTCGPCSVDAQILHYCQQHPRAAFCNQINPSPSSATGHINWRQVLILAPSGSCGVPRFRGHRRVHRTGANSTVLFAIIWFAGVRRAQPSQVSELSASSSE